MFVWELDCLKTAGNYVCAGYIYTPTCPFEWNLLNQLKVLMSYLGLHNQRKRVKVIYAISDPGRKKLKAGKEERQGQLHKACQLWGGSRADTNLLQHLFTLFEVVILLQHKLGNCLLLKTTTAPLFNKSLVWRGEKWYWFHLKKLGHSQIIMRGVMLYLDEVSGYIL